MIKLNTVLKLLIISGAFLTAYGALGQTSSFEMAKRMYPGINLGNTFDATPYEGAWAPATKEADFEAFKKAGFKCVRIPITWHAGLSNDDSTLRLSNEKPFKVQPNFYKRIDTVLKWSLDRGLITVINVHHDHWLKKSTTFDENKERFYSLWKQLANHYKNYPETLLFEIVNEPHHETDGKDDGLTVEQVDELNKTVFEIIRKKNPTRITIFSGRGWGGLHDLQKATPPAANDKYLMGTYHSYSPWQFAGEGNGSWGSEEDIKSMNNEFEMAKKYTVENKVPVFIGEFGAQHQCDYNSRMKHFAHYVENIRKYNTAATVWDDCGFRFKVYDRESGQWDDTKDILVNYTPSAPTHLKITLLDGDFVNIEWTNRAENIEKTTIERRVGRAGSFEILNTIYADTSYTDKTSNKKQHYYYYRVVNHLKSGEKSISYPQSIYIP